MNKAEMPMVYKIAEIGIFAILWWWEIGLPNLVTQSVGQGKGDLIPTYVECKIF